jgi:protein-S-isoprenylcysteine O-methyltransferase Ste14
VELVAPHGFLELSCIAVAAAAGFRVGWAVINPGPRARAAALVAEARVGAEVVLGTIPWLVVAGVVEGFVTPRRIGVPAALAVGIGLAALYWALVLWRGRPAGAGTAGAHGGPEPLARGGAPASTAAPAPSP